MNDKPQYEQKDNTGVLFKNSYKTKDSHPEYTGNAKIDGVEYKLAVWMKKSARGTTFMSLTFQNKDDMHPMGVGKPIDTSKAREDTRSLKEKIGDDIPF